MRMFVYIINFRSVCLRGFCGDRGVRGSETLSLFFFFFFFFFLLPVQKRVDYKRKEFVPQGSKSRPYWEGCFVQENKSEVKKEVVSFVKTVEKELPSISVLVSLSMKKIITISQLAFYVNLHRAVIGPSATLTGRWRPAIDLRRMLTGIFVTRTRQTEWPS